MHETEMHTNPLSWNGNSWNGDSRTLVLADVNKQKQQWDTLLLSGKERWERLSADNMSNKSQADANRDYIWITSGFSPGIWPKSNWWAARQG